MATDNGKKLLPQIDLVNLIIQLWSQKWKIILIAFLFGVLGFSLSLSIPKRYRTVVTLTPESSESPLSSAASSISSMLGMKMAEAGIDAIYPELYPDIIKTIPFSVEMLNIKVCTKDSSYCGDLYHYLAYNQKAPWWSVLEDKIKTVFKKKQSGGSDTLDPYRLSKRQVGVIENFNSMVDCEIDVKTSVITLTSVMQDKNVACIVADSLCAKLQEYITAYKTNKAKNDLNSINRMYEDAKKKYLEAQNLYTVYIDKNVNLVRESAKAEAVRLENEMDIAFSAYSEFASQMAVAQAKLQEKTPAFTILEPARLAEWHFAPKKSKIAIIFAFFGGFMACAFYYLKINRSRIVTFFLDEEK